MLTVNGGYGRGEAARTMATELDDARYISLMSFKRDGGAVETPVWVAPVDGKLAIFTNRDSYKVKRVRRNPRVRVARCDARGKVLGAWLDGTCAIVEDRTQQARMMDAIRRKYGWQARVLDFFARLAGRVEKRAYLEVALT
jgi:PPOX class probable F420-dependent enzyme